MSNSPSKKASRSKSIEEAWNYEQTVARVEEILAKIESGELELASVFEEFAIAMEYLKECESFLSERQKQVDLLIETLTDDSEF
jgi:exodeoxyribonuclease VII small subunit